MPEDFWSATSTPVKGEDFWSATSTPVKQAPAAAPASKEPGRPRIPLVASEFGGDEAFLKGVTKGLFGLPGALEEFGTYTVPSLLGFDAKHDKSPTGGSTFFPTPKEVGQSALGRALGLTNIPKGYEAFDTAGEFAGSLISPGTILKTGKAAVEGAGSLARGVQAAFSPLSTTGRIGKATSVSQVGESIGSQLTGRLDQLVASRSKGAEAAFKKYFEEGAPHGKDIVNSYLDNLSTIKTMASRSGSREELQLIDKLKQRITNREFAPNIQGMEKERRFLKKIEDGFAPEGYEAIPQKLAKDLRRSLENEIDTRIPSAKAARDEYAKLSEPINKFRTAVGEAATKEIDEFLPSVPKVDPAKLPGKFFESKATAQALKELSGDPAFAEKAARSHIAVETSGFRTGKEVTDYIRKNHDWLQEFPDLENKLSQIAGSHRVGRALRTLGTWGAGAAVGTGALGIGKSILGGF